MSLKEERLAAKAAKLEAEKKRLEDMYGYEAGLAGSARFVFGIDEAGRGPLCGPVVAACCILPADPGILYLNDSKKLSEKKRELICEEIREKAVAYGIGQASASRIDEINILNATMEAMKDAFDACMEMMRQKNLKQAEENGDFSMDAMDGVPAGDDSMVLVDGNRTVPGIPLTQRAVVGGDAKCPSISAASILAKVTRDHLLIEYDRLHPEYGFAKHKGYGTKEHVDAILKYGALDIHRKSFLTNVNKSL
ncbi:MAG: ribonuclease HII [Lachnospiraceae bacterium]|nr:ribonuclease HII [Lachnospiraceae bacterium]